MDRTERPFAPRFKRLWQATLCCVLFGGTLTGSSTAAQAAPAADNGNTALVLPQEYRVASAGVTVTRLRLYFENKRPETTVKRNAPSPPANVEVEFSGAGLLEGFWEVDDRLLAKVSLYAVSGKSIVIKTPETTGIPTFDPGTHRVRFVITTPGGAQPVEAVYFVTAEEFSMFSVKPVSPADKAAIDHGATTFRWETGAPADSCRIEFFEMPGEKPVFSANTTAAGKYTLPAAAAKQKFHPGKDYFWKVKTLGPGGEVTGESMLRRFSFGPGTK